MKARMNPVKPLVAACAALICAVAFAETNVFENGSWSLGTPVNGQDLLVRLNGNASIAVPAKTAVTNSSLTVTGIGTLSITSGGLFSVSNALFAANVTASMSYLDFNSRNGELTIAEGVTFDFTNDKETYIRGVIGPGKLVKRGSGKLVFRNGSTHKQCLSGGVTVEVTNGMVEAFYNGEKNALGRNSPAIGDATVVVDGGMIDNWEPVYIQGTFTVVNNSTSIRTIFTHEKGADRNLSLTRVYGPGRFVKKGAGEVRLQAVLEAPQSTAGDVQLSEVVIDEGRLTLNGFQEKTWNLRTPISGAGELAVRGSNVVTFVSTNTFRGGLTVLSSQVKAAHAASFGTGPLACSGAGTLDINGHPEAFSNGVTIAGRGYKGTAGALCNWGAGMGMDRLLPGPVVLSGDATVLCPNKLSLGSLPDGPSVTLNGFTLTKTGAEPLGLYGATIGGEGKVVIAAGNLTSQGDSGAAIPDGTLELEAGTSFILDSPATVKALSLRGGAVTSTRNLTVTDRVVGHGSVANLELSDGCSVLSDSTADPIAAAKVFGSGVVRAGFASFADYKSQDTKVFAFDDASSFAGTFVLDESLAALRAVGIRTETDGVYVENGIGTVPENRFAFDGSGAGSGCVPLAFTPTTTLATRYEETDYGKALRLTAADPATRATGTGLALEGDFTFVLRARSTLAADAVLVSLGDSATGGLALVADAQGAVRLVTFADGAIVAQTSPAAVEDPAGAYHLYAVTGSDGKLTFWADGQSVAELDGGLSADDFALGTTVGAVSGLVAAENVFLDEFRVYDGAFTDGQIAALADCMPVFTPQTENVWTGEAQDGDWANPLNWSKGAQPGEGDDVRLPAALARTQTVPTLSLRNLTVEGSGALTLSGGMLTVEGVLTVDGTLVADEGTLAMAGATVITAGSRLEYAVASAAAASSGIVGAGALVKSGPGVLSVGNDASGEALGGGLKVDVLGGGILLAGAAGVPAGLGTLSLVTLEEGTSLDNAAGTDVRLLADLVVSNAAAAAVFTGAGTRTTDVTGTGSITKLGAGALEFGSTLGAKEPYVAQVSTPTGAGQLNFTAGVDSVSEAQFRMNSRFRYSGGAEFGIAGVGTFSKSIEIASCSTVNVSSASLILGVYGPGTLVKSGSGRLFIKRTGTIYTPSVQDATVVVREGNVDFGWSDSTVYPKYDGATFQGETMLRIEGGTTTSYGWPQVYGTLTVENDRDHDLLKWSSDNPRLQDEGGGAGRLVKRGAGKLTLYDHMDLHNGLVIEEGTVAFSNARHGFHMNTTNFCGAGYLVVDHAIPVSNRLFRAGNVLLGLQGRFVSGLFDATDIPIAGTLKPQVAVPQYCDRFTFADGARIDVSGLTDPFGSSGMVLNVPADAMVDIDLGARAEKIRRGTKVISWAAAPDCAFTISGEGAARRALSLAKEADGGYVYPNRGLILIVE